MLLIFGAILLAVLAGLALGGKLRSLSAMHIRWPLLAVAGLVLQVVPVRESSKGLAFSLLMVSLGLLFAFAVLNLRLPGFWLILIGIWLNALVIGVNQGMPVTHHALVVSDQSATLGALEHGGGAKHHLAGAGDHLIFLADVIPIPNPVHQVLSVGDVFTYAGVMWFVVASMRRRPSVAAEKPAPQQATS